LRPLLSAASHSGEQCEVFLFGPFRMKFPGVEVVHPLLAALFWISVISLAGSVVELPCDGVPFVLVILEAA